MAELPSLSIVIPTYNGLDHLRRCLPAVTRCAPAGTQIIVVDDASTDGSADWIRRHHPTVEVVQLAANQGFCAAVKAGLAQARHEIVELLNNDTEVQPGWADASLQWFSHADVGSVAPLVLLMDQPDVMDSAGQEYHICGWAYNRGFGRTLSPEDLQPREVFGASGSCGFYRLSALKRTGDLLPEYGAYFEDTDLAFRLRWAGYRCIYEPAARVLHKVSATYSRSARTVWLYSRNEELVFWINLPWHQLLLGLVPHLGFLFARTLCKLFQRQLLPYFKGKIDAVLLWRQILLRRRQIRDIVSRNSLAVDLALTRSAWVVRQGVTWILQRHQ